MALLRVASQNVTEGYPTPALRAADIVITQETDETRLRRGLPGRAHFFPDEDSHQSISWEPEVLDVDKAGYVRFHRSGRAEDWPYPTPARGMPYVKGQLVGGTKAVVAGVWLLNSWHPVRPDHHTAHRNRVGRRSLRIMRRRIAFWHAQGYTVILAGDFNSLRWHGRIGGMQTIQGRGLDRAYVSKRGELAVFSGPSRGAKTGVGNDLQHESVLFTLATKRKR
jgi:hypothetical protein